MTGRYKLLLYAIGNFAAACLIGLLVFSIYIAAMVLAIVIALRLTGVPQ